MAPRRILEALSIVAVLSASFFVACSTSESPSGESEADAGETREGSVKVDGSVEPNTVAFDDDGILVPSKLRAVGAAIPRGFERKMVETGRSIFIGPVEAEKVVSFYHKYLDCSYVTKLGRGWKFKNATPRAPGDPSRSVNVLVIQESEKTTRVILTDTSLRIRADTPDSGLKTFEELHKAAHKGEGSVQQPIPGTY